MHEINNIKLVHLNFCDRSLIAVSSLTNTITLIELTPLVDGHFRSYTTLRILLSSQTHTLPILNSAAHVYLSACDKPYSTTAMLAPLVARFGDCSRATAKLDHITCLSTFNFSSCAFYFVGDNTLKSSTCHVFALQAYYLDWTAYYDLDLHAGDKVWTSVCPFYFWTALLMKLIHSLRNK
jgi:hypothetical protein